MTNHRHFNIRLFFKLTNNNLPKKSYCQSKLNVSFNLIYTIQCTDFPLFDRFKIFPMNFISISEKVIKWNNSHEAIEKHPMFIFFWVSDRNPEKWNNECIHGIERASCELIKYLPIYRYLASNAILWRVKTICIKQQFNAIIWIFQEFFFTIFLWLPTQGIVTK